MRHNRKIIYLAGFLFSFPIALTSYINSSFLGNYFSIYHIGILYIIASALSIWGLTIMPKILTRFGNRKAIFYFSLVFFVCLLLLAFGGSVSVIIPVFILYQISSYFIIASLDIFVKDFSKSGNVGRFRGFYISIINIAWVLSQMISGSIIAKSSFKGMYVLSALFMILVIIIFILFLQDFIDPKYKKTPILKTLKLFIRDKNISKIYFIDLIIKFFYAWMVIYSPIYLHQYIGFSWTQIGFIFTIMLVPFMLLSFPLGVLSDKIGEKKIMIIGFFLMSIFTLLISFVSVPIVWLWALLLLGTRIGAAITEAMAESYFFKVVSEKNSDSISFFRNTAPFSYIVGPLLAIPILFFIPSFSYLFLILAAIILLGLWVSLKLKDVR